MQKSTFVEDRAALGRVLGLSVLAAVLLAGCPKPPPAKPTRAARTTANVASLDDGAAAAKKRQWQRAYEIFAYHFLRNPRLFETAPERYAQFVTVCFELSRHRAAVALARRFVALRPSDPRIGMVVRALTLNGKHQEAIQHADAYLARGLGHRPELLYWRAKAYFSLGQYRDAAASMSGAKNGVGGLRDYWVAESLRRQGRYAEARVAAERAARGSKAPHVQALLSELVRAERTGLDVRVVRPGAIELSIYHLLTDEGGGPYGSLITVQVANLRPSSAELRVEAELVGMSQPVSRQLTVVGSGGGPPQSTSVALTPQLDRASATGVGERQTRTLRIKVVRLQDNAVILEESRPITVLPRDYVAYSRQSPEDPDKLVRDDGGFGVLITPRARWIDPVLGYAKSLHPKRELSGPFADSVSQVKAIYEYLRRIGVSYAIGSPTLYRRKGEPMVQRIRPPGVVLQLRAAQCWEGTNVFAALLEALKLEPVLFRVPGHILVGWRKNQYDREPGAAGTPYYFLETTVIGKASFEDALRTGAHRLLKEYRAGNLKSRMARIIEVSTLRKRGILPQPWDD